MAWDDLKSTLESRPNVPDDKKLTAAEWNAMTADQQAHSTRHEDGGADELDVSNLSGVLADAQTPQTEAVQDIVGALVTGAGNVTVTYDDTNDVLTVDTSALNTEEVEDAVGALVTAGNAITVNYDDGANTLSVGVDESALSFYDGTNLTAPVDNQSVKTGRQRITEPSPIVKGSVGWQSDFDGADPDARLDNALNAASAGDIILLENASYEDNRTIDTEYEFRGRSLGPNAGSIITGDWDFTTSTTVCHARLINVTWTVDGQGSTFRRLFSAGFESSLIEVSESRNVFTGLTRFDVTLTSDSSLSVVDSCTNISVTDNGTNNVVGDIA